jgi:hypothetical protein
MRDALASFRDHLLGVMSESQTKDTLIELSNDILNSSAVKHQITDTRTPPPISGLISSSQSSILSSYGIGVGLAFAGAILWLVEKFLWLGTEVNYY